MESESTKASGKSLKNTVIFDVIPLSVNFRSTRTPMDKADKNLRSRLFTTQLYVVLDGGESRDDFTCRAQAIVEAGAGAVQLREKRLADRCLLERARILRDITRSTKTLLIINDRPDIARLSDADGVHLGQDDLLVSAARQLLPQGRLIGISTHDAKQAHEAVHTQQADYIGVGPTFPSLTKSFHHFPGLSLLEQVAQDETVPSFAIGGIHLENLEKVLRTGIHRVAVSSAIQAAVDSGVEVKKFLSQLQRYEISKTSNPAT